MKKLIFFRSFPTFHQKFKDLPPIFFIRIVKRAFSMSRRTLPSKLDFVSKNFYLTRFPESARTTIGLLTIFFFSGDVKIAVTVSRTHFQGNIFREKSFLKFSIRLWGRLFETPGENFAAGFSKLHLSCPDGTLKNKYFFFKTFLQDFCEFEQSKFWTFSEFFSGSFVNFTISVSTLVFWEKFSGIS